MLLSQVQVLGATYHSQLKVKVVVFTTILGFINIEFGQINQLLAIGPCLGGLQVCDLSNRWVLLINKGILVYILSSRGIIVYNKGVLVYILSFKSIIVYNLGVRRALAYKVNLKATLIYSLDLFKWVGYKASDSIKFKGVKGSAFFDLLLDLLLTPLY